MHLKIGSKIDDRFEIVAELGEGGFATVYRAHDQELDRYVAIKVLKSGSHSSSNDVARFLREAQVLSKLKHKNIVSVFACGVLPGSAAVFVVMEYLQGVTLHTLLQEKGKLEYSEVRSILLQCCDALSYAHKQGVIHRDISPANIHLSQNAETPIVRILDFGLVKLIDCNDEQLTKTGLVVGNPSYMSPQLAAGERVDARSDIYSIGCVIYQCMTGETPFTADTPVGLLYKQLHSYPPEPITNWIDKDQEKLFQTLVLRCIQKDPDKRFQTCDEIVAYVERKDPLLTQANLRSWGDSQSTATTNSMLVQAVRIAVFTITLLSLLFLIWYSPASTALINGTLTFLPGSASVESAAAFLLSAKKLASAKFAYERLAREFEQQKNYVAQARAYYKICTIDQRTGKTSECISTCRMMLAALSKASNNQLKQTLLEQLWNLLQHVTELNHQDIRELQVDIFEQILAFKSPDKTEITRFSPTIRKIIQTDLTKLPLSVKLRLVAAMVKCASIGRIEGPTGLANDFVTGMRYCKDAGYSALCQTLATKLLRYHDLTFAEIDKLELFSIRCKFRTQPRESLASLNKLIDAQKMRGEDLDTYNAKIEFLRDIQQDPRLALDVCEEAIKIPDWQSVLDKNGALNLIGLLKEKIHLLGMIGKTDEIWRVAEELCRHVKFFGEHHNAVDVVSKIKQTKHIVTSYRSEQEFGSFFQDDVLVSVMDTLESAKQDKQIVSLCEWFADKAESRNWMLSLPFRGELLKLNRASKIPPQLFERCMKIKQELRIQQFHF